MKTKQQAYNTIKALMVQITATAAKHELEASVMLLDQENPKDTLHHDFHLSMFGAMVELNLVMRRFGLSPEKEQEIRAIVEAELQRQAQLIPGEPAAAE